MQVRARAAFGGLRSLRQSRARFSLALLFVAASAMGQNQAPCTMSNRPPATVREWTKTFESSALYRHEYGRLFEDWLDLCICCFANQQLEERYLSIAKRYTRPELDAMAQLLAQLVLIHEEHTAGGGWYDALGTIYEYLASRSKASRLGQFFTPHGLCEVMARITMEDPQPGATILDCACGSGRLLLAGHVHARNHGTIYANDVDPVCVKMTALNFWLHGIRGEVACMNTLSLEWHFAFHVHPRTTWPFITLLTEERKTESHLYVDREQVATKTVQAAAASMDLFNQGTL